jgi:hypothetical protein
MADNKFRATITKIDRLKNSTNGNPTYRLHTSAGTYRTKTDAQISYMVGSRLLGTEVELTVDGRGHVWAIETL